MKAAMIIGALAAGLLLILVLAALGSFIEWLIYGNETPEQRKRRYERECELEQSRDYDDGGFLQ